SSADRDGPAGCRKRRRLESDFVPCRRGEFGRRRARPDHEGPRGIQEQPLARRAPARHHPRAALLSNSKARPWRRAANRQSTQGGAGLVGVKNQEKDLRGGVMRIGFLGAGALANVLGARFIAGGHKLLVSYSRDSSKLEETAKRLGA